MATAKKTAKKATKKITVTNTFREMIDEAYKQKIFNSVNNMSLERTDVNISDVGKKDERVSINIRFAMHEYTAYSLILLSTDIECFVHNFGDFLGGTLELQDSMLYAERRYDDDMDMTLTLYMTLKSGKKRKMLIDAHLQELAVEKAKRAEVDKAKREKAKKLREKKEAEEYDLFLKLKERYE